MEQIILDTNNAVKEFKNNQSINGVYNLYKQLNYIFNINRYLFSGQMLIKIEILKDIPKFIGNDNNEYGKYCEGDIIVITDEIGNQLIKKGFAKFISKFIIDKEE